MLTLTQPTHVQLVPHQACQPRTGPTHTHENITNPLWLRWTNLREPSRPDCVARIESCSANGPYGRAA